MGKKVPRTDPTFPQKKARTVSSLPSVNAMSGFNSGGPGTRTPIDDDMLYDDLVQQSPIYVMQMKTNANPSPLLKLKTVLGLHWKEESSQDTISPDSADQGTVDFFKDFETQNRTIFTRSPKKGDDVDRIGFAMNLCGFYFNGGAEQAKNLLMHFGQCLEIPPHIL